MPEPLAGGDMALHVDRDSLSFSAAHFSILGGGRERLHGHNYRLALRVRGQVRADGTVVDFAQLKAAVREQCALLDHRMLVPTLCPEVIVEAEDDVVRLAVGDDRFSFPAGDVALLPLRNTTCECLAGHLLGRLRERLGAAVGQLEVTVEEAPGQGASCAETAQV